MRIGRRAAAGNSASGQQHGAVPQQGAVLDGSREKEGVLKGHGSNGEGDKKGYGWASVERRPQGGPQASHLHDRLLDVAGPHLRVAPVDLVPRTPVEQMQTGPLRAAHEVLLGRCETSQCVPAVLSVPPLAVRQLHGPQLQLLQPGPCRSGTCAVKPPRFLLAMHLRQRRRHSVCRGAGGFVERGPLCSSSAAGSMGTGMGVALVPHFAVVHFLFLRRQANRSARTTGASGPPSRDRWNGKAHPEAVKRR